MMKISLASFSNKKEEFPEKPVNEALLSKLENFIDSSVRKGYSLEKIRSNILKKNWPEEIVEKADFKLPFRQYKS